MTVNIYIHTTFTRPNQKGGAYAWVIEYITQKGPATVSKVGTISNTTLQKAEAHVFAEALNVLTRKCDVRLYTDAKSLAAVLNYRTQWSKNGFKNSKGEELSEDIKAIIEKLDGTECEYIKGKNEYSEWLRREAEKEAENVI